MTIVIGINAVDGAVLIADALVILRGSSTEYKKIESGIYYPISEYDKSRIRDEHFSGVYSAASGLKYLEFDVDSLFFGDLSRGPNRADRLTDKIILETTLEEIHHRKEELTKRLEEYTNPYIKKQWDDTARTMYEEIELLRDIITPRAFIEQRGLSSLKYTLLRISDNFKPDILSLKNMNLKRVSTYNVHGSGKKYVEDTLKKDYRKNIDVNQATELAFSAINKALSIRDEFRGFHLVRVRRTEDGINHIQTAFNSETNHINPEEVVFHGPFFY